MSPKVDYPPPAHSSRVGSMKQQQEKMASLHAVNQKNELAMFGYPPYHPQNQFAFSHADPKNKDLHKGSNVGLLAKSASPIERDNLPNPPPLMSEMKSSVIVKHEAKNPHHMEPRVSIAHSPSPKLMSHYMQMPPTSKSNMYEYRSPTQSPHHLSHLDAQNMGAKNAHHRQISSPHRQRQSPHAPQHSSPEIIYRGPQDTMIYPTPGKANYQYLASTAGYSHQTTNVSNSKPKVSSPAPHHIYGKPSAGILTGLQPSPREQAGPAMQIMNSKPPMPMSISPSPFQQASQYHPPPPQVSAQLNPPPAHRTAPYDR